MTEKDEKKPQIDLERLKKLMDEKGWKAPELAQYAKIKYDTVYLGSKSRRQVHRYLSDRATAPGAHSALFVAMRRPRRRLTTSGIVQLMDRLRDATGIAHCTCHTFRRTFAKNCLDNGMNIYALAKLMGHADIKMLERYLKISEHDLAAAHEEHGVVDRL